MNKIVSVARILFIICLFVDCTSNTLHSQIVDLAIHARPVPDNPDVLRLLPREQELRDGNAAIELLRMPWEQNNFMMQKRKLMSDWLEMAGDNPELIKHENVFVHFKNRMRRAAFTRDADWDYPLGEQPFMSILLPDVQGMRDFAGRVLSLWIRIQISKGNLQGAHEGLVIQMSCARHVFRTPITVCQLVGADIARSGFTQLEDLIQNPNAENYYYALSMLPDTLGELKPAIDLESTAIRSSIPSLAKASLKPGDEEWKIAFNELFHFYTIFGTTGVDREELKLVSRILAKELRGLTSASKSQIAAMSDEEISVRWFLAQHKQLGAKYVAAVQLPHHQAVQELLELEKEIEKLNEKTIIEFSGIFPEGATPEQFFGIYSGEAYIACLRFGRTAKLLQIVEAIRHHASVNGNRLPESLNEIDLVLPLDPFTNKPADYNIKDGVAVLCWPQIDNLEDQKRFIRSYRLKMAISK